MLPLAAVLPWVFFLLLSFLSILFCSSACLPPYCFLPDSLTHAHHVFSRLPQKMRTGISHFSVQLVSKHMSCPCFDCWRDQSVCQELCSSRTGQRSKKCLLIFYLTEKSRWSTRTGAELAASQNSTGWSFRKLCLYTKNLLSVSFCRKGRSLLSFSISKSLP